MNVRAAIAVAVLCAACKPANAPRVKPTSAEWVARCTERVELARLALVRLSADFKDVFVETNASMAPSVRWVANGRKTWYAFVGHGTRCPSTKTIRTTEWRDEPGYSWMQIDNDCALIQGASGDETVKVAFRREMQFALRECLLDARGLPAVAPEVEDDDYQSID